MNLLSVGAAFGVAVFQWGWGSSLVGIEETVPIPWMPGWLDRIVPDLKLEGGASEHAPEEAPPGGDVAASRCCTPSLRVAHCR